MNVSILSLNSATLSRSKVYAHVAKCQRFCTLLVVVQQAMELALENVLLSTGLRAKLD